MGIQGLTKLIAEHAPNAIKRCEIKSYSGNKIAIDASVSMYQFMIAVRQPDGQLLVNDRGEITSHLAGMFYRTLRMMHCGIKPVYVFDGNSPSLKSEQLAKRKALKEMAQIKAMEMKSLGKDIRKYSKRTIKITREHTEECKRLLTIMGIPYLEALSEAEAQCAELAKEGKVFAAASEDMDTLVFKAPILLRHLTFSGSRIHEIHLDKVLTGLGLDMIQVCLQWTLEMKQLNDSKFIDLCILLGCDYTKSIKGIGPKTAYKLIKKHGTIDELVNHVGERLKGNIPKDWNYAEARQLFVTPKVIPATKINIYPPQASLEYA
ncbi:hypothetical protein G6F57_002752 [Rhizopus arrhizus]|uniref:Flap endonuclease 1 n=1 Tax=Rhizopus oryzae TaxID=64495 RepID=A0A9P7BRZ4_RHIOR|nr:hypothetical protein G6F23_001496 [Rhizopus arrhizus]KAG1415471.1 hypothetical protein G6F58_006461 [Rhizopus delemar]KAG0768041.1 hypothetical protein G6F24_002283 [Rhizopus arrhizus]KAG0794608.1 hypothetical protein G6F21_002741 [Rhizopus arrhizus]KAG0801649.1 hypothetical protein G6F22_001039 [Rhizopus arrhizus]